jgi:hypothetical protein
MWTNRDVLVTVASWEDRFLEGFKRVLEAVRTESVIMCHSDRYSEWTQTQRAEVANLCRDRGIGLSEGVLYEGNPSKTWHETFVPLFSAVDRGATVCVDISTMPREVVWSSLWFLQYRECRIGYVYNRPVRYGEWLSRDPDRPRLVYKMSGIMRMGGRTALVILAGYDVDRVRHLVNVFEPAVTLLGIQADSLDPLNPEKMKAVIDEFAGDNSVTTFSVDAFGPDRGRSQVDQMIAPIRDSHNIVMASMGPKLTAIALYELHRQYENLGLVYLPSSEFNRDYSKGLGEMIWGCLESRMVQ